MNFIRVKMCIVFIVMVVFLFCLPQAYSDIYEETVYFDSNHSYQMSADWVHTIPLDFDPISASVEVTIWVNNFAMQGDLDLMCSNTDELDYGDVYTAPSKPGYIGSLDNDIDLWQWETVSYSLDSLQLNWLSDDGQIHMWLFGPPYYEGDPSAAFYLDSITLTAIGEYARPKICIGPNSLSNSCIEGTNASNQSFEIWNCGVETLQYSVSDNVDWLSCMPTSSTSTGEHDSIALNYSTTELAPGSYTGSITISASGASNSPQTVNVSLTVISSDPVISISQDSLSNNCLEGEDAMIQYFEVWNSGSETLNYSISDDATWLDCIPSNGASSGESDTIEVQYATSGLEPGSYFATITISDQNMNASPQTISVELTITALEPRLAVFSSTSGGILHIIDYFDAPGPYPYGLTSDGAYLWNCDLYDDKIYQLDSIGNIVSSFDSPGGAPKGLAFDGVYLWNSDNADDKIYQLDISGNTINSFDSPGTSPTGVTSPTGLAFDGTHLWSADRIGATISKLDGNGDILYSFHSPSTDPTGLTYDGTCFWNADSSSETIFKLDSTANVIDAFDSPYTSPQGLASDGTYLWCADNDSDTIFQLVENPVLLPIGSSKNRFFTISNNGNSNLFVDQVSIAGIDNSAFLLTSDNCSGESITPSGSCEIELTFAPLSIGIKQAALELSSNDPFKPLLNIPLSGEGIELPQSCIGNLDFDGDVDGSDMARLSENFDCTNQCREDFNNDGLVDTLDLEMFASNYGRSDCLGHFYEPFDSFVPNWFASVSGIWLVEDGVMKMTGSMPEPGVSRDLHYFGDFSDFIFQIAINRIQGSLGYAPGISFRNDGSWYNQYRLLLAESDIGNCYYQIEKHVNQEPTVLVDWTPSTAINPGYDVWNIVKVMCNGPIIKIYLNDILVETIIDTEFLAGGIGVFAPDVPSEDDMNCITHFDDAQLIIIK